MSKELERALELLREVSASLAWNCFGECRAVHDGPIMPAQIALEEALAFLAAQQAEHPFAKRLREAGPQIADEVDRLMGDQYPEQAEGAQGEREAKPMAGCTYRLLQAHTAGEFSEEGGSPTVEAMAVESFDAQIAEGHFHDGDSYMAGFSNAIYAQALPMICLLDGEARAALAQPSTERDAKPGLFCRNCDSRLMVRGVCGIYCPKCEKEDGNRDSSNADDGRMRSAADSASVPAGQVCSDSDAGLNAQPSPAPELERPDITTKHGYPAYSVAQHERIVGALRAEIEEVGGLAKRLDELLSQTAIAMRGPEPALTRYGYADLPQRVKTLRDERDVAQARVAGLETELAMALDAAAKGDDARAILGGMELERPVAVVCEDCSNPVGAIDTQLPPGTKLYARPVPVAQAGQVAEGVTDLCRFLAKLYCELDGLRYSTAKLPPEEVADALICKWPVLQGTRNQLNIKRISEQPYDESKLQSGVAALLAAAPQPAKGGE